MPRILAALFLSPILSMAQTSPRIQQVLPSVSLPETEPLIVDLEGDGFPDILFPPADYSGISHGNAVLVKNLGGRNFGEPRISHLRQSSNPSEDSPSLFQVEPAAPLQFLINERADLDFSFRPVIIEISAAGKFGIRTPLAPSTDARWMGVDLDGDATDELLQTRLLNDETELVIWDRQADGSYSRQAIIFDGYATFDDVDAVDFDGDGDLDLFLSNSRLEGVILERTGPREFAAAPLATYFEAQDIRFSDLDGDGLPEVHSGGEDSVFTWYPNLGGLEFGPREMAPLEPGTSSSGALLKVDAMDSSPAILSFLRSENSAPSVDRVRFGTWEVLSSHEVDSSGVETTLGGPQEFGLADLDGDGMDDLLLKVSDQASDLTFFPAPVPRLAVAWGNAGGFSPAAYLHAYPIQTTIELVADFDEDGDSDLILGPDSSKQFSLLANDGTGNFGPPVVLTELAPPAGAPEGVKIWGLVNGDFNNDGVEDLAVDYSLYLPGAGYRNACGVAIGLGDGTFTPPTLPDGAFDLITTFPCTIDHLVDWDGDGDLDAIGSGAWRENLGGYFDQNYRGLISGAMITDFLGNPVSLLSSSVGDVDGDGHPDIISEISRYEAPEVGDIPLGLKFESFASVSFNDGLGGIEQVVEFDADLFAYDFLGNPISVGNIVVADLNLDGFSDICIKELGGVDFLGNPYSTNRWLRNPGSGSRALDTWTSLPLFGDVPQSPLLDFDGDGTLEWVNPYGFLQPTTAGPLSSPGYNLLGGVSIANRRVKAADFDGDGDADFLLNDNSGDLLLVKNPLVNELSAITRALLGSGVKGANTGPLKDADGDGRSNEDEFLLGTDPLVADSVGANLLKIQPSANGAETLLHINYPPGTLDLRLRYQVEMSTNLSDWEPCGDPIPTVGTLLAPQSVSPAPEETAGSTFYRLRGWHEVDPE